MGESGGWEGRFSRTSTGSILNNGIVLLARGTDEGKKQRTGEVLCFLLDGTAGFLQRKSM